MSQWLRDPVKRSQIFGWLFLSSCMVLTVTHVNGAELAPKGQLQFSGVSQVDVSGISFTPDQSHLILVSDESNGVLVLKRGSNPTQYSHVTTTPILDPASEGEADLEAVVTNGPFLYAIGSHSKKRKEVRADEFKRKKNRERLQSVEDEKDRRQLVRMNINDVLDGDAEITRADLWDRVKSNDVLKSFVDVPGKENGLDIEAMAVDGDRLLVGFRSPVLRGGYAVVMDTKFAADSQKELTFLDLKGSGLRDAYCLEPGRYLLLCGPSGEQDHPYEIRLWNGKDMIPGTDGPAEGNAVSLGTLKRPENAANGKAEGLTLYARDGNKVDVVVVFDGIAGGAPTVYRVELPAL